jgi:fatty-acyl-CoA synthase
VASWWVPERFEFVDALPRTTVGKVDKVQLRTRFT